ncbi:hypothetical protein [Spirosoma sordidisoli]|uniref:Uncharacterized protein n=1 Tax=Spirosoma sordidisoli TaxID=2502893 RepID=A0A4Q2UMM8_9BACT|nr:hypothetical protein [Spirosoma sordidisoli]RYC70644.1 hypothetical protein EQG79_00395 [Spirosoma sordidisoli]
MTRELVVAHTTESLDWLSAVPAGWQITVYSRTLTEYPGADVQPTEETSHHGVVIRHCIARYNTLSDLTAFVTGNPFAHIQHSLFWSCFKTDTEHILGGWYTCQANGEPNHPGLPLTTVQAMINVEPVYPIGFCAGSQYVVSRATIQSRSDAFYWQMWKVLGAGELYPFCIERLWPTVWNLAPAERETWGMLYTHHKIADAVLNRVLAHINAMGLREDRLVVVGWHEDGRIPLDAVQVHCRPTDTHWHPAIYEQMIAGLEVIPPDANVLTLEHDILYPHTYLDTMSRAMIRHDKVYFYTHVRHIDVRPVPQQLGFWASDPNGTRTLQSGAGGRCSHLLSEARQNLASYRNGTFKGDFELGINTGWEGVYHQHPLLDIRQGNNSTDTGYDKAVYFASNTETYWGDAMPLIKRLQTF